MADLNVGLDIANTIYTDSQSASVVLRNSVFHARTKHIEVHYHYVRERLSIGEISLTYVSTQNNLTYLFTKALSCEKFKAFRKALGLLPFMDRSCSQDMVYMAWSGFPIFYRIEDARTWLQDYALFLLEIALSEDEGVLQVFPRLVRGKAKRWVDGQHEEVKTDRDALEKAFRCKYVLDAQLLEVKRKLDGLKQKYDGDLQAFEYEAIDILHAEEVVKEDVLEEQGEVQEDVLDVDLMKEALPTNEDTQMQCFLTLSQEDMFVDVIEESLQVLLDEDITVMQQAKSLDTCKDAASVVQSLVCLYADRQWWASLRSKGEAPKTWKTCRVAIVKKFLSHGASDQVLIAWRSLKLEEEKNIQRYVEKFWYLHLKATVYKRINFSEQKQQLSARLPEEWREYVNAQRPRTISEVIHHSMIASNIKFHHANKEGKSKFVKEKPQEKGRQQQGNNFNKSGKPKDKQGYQGKDRLPPKDVEHYHKDN
ncbi:hypothetical protein L7F22_047866 [Adiantum nelumboides]|nr:hypothetical protein [Adiantum nelumboides]